MLVKGKVETIFRLIGSIIILATTIASIAINFMIFNDTITFVIYLTFILFLFSLSFMKKAERRLFNEHKSALYILGLILFLILVIFSCIYHIDQISSRVVSLISISASFLNIISWHYSLSIYRIKKYYFILSSIGYLVLTLISFLLTINNYKIYLLIQFILMLIGFLLILVCEILMKKKGYLRYID